MKNMNTEKVGIAPVLNESPVQSNYILGHSVHEYERLMLQGRILRPYTERFFHAAGLGAGMRVLDVGCGVGDVTLLAADIVGPGGSVVGVDRDAGAIEEARLRAAHSGCSSQVNFVTTDIDDFESSEQFDAIVGRYILLYQPNAAATIRHLLGLLKPGGIIAFHEFDFSDTCPSFPPCPAFDQALALIRKAYRRSGTPSDFGRQLGKSFLDAGLPFPTIVSEGVVGGGRASYVYDWIASTLLSVASVLERQGITLPSNLAIDQGLVPRLEEEAVRSGSQLLAPVQFGAWTRKALMQSHVGPTTPEEAERLLAASHHDLEREITAKEEGHNL